MLGRSVFSTIPQAARPSRKAARRPRVICKVHERPAKDAAMTQRRAKMHQESHDGSPWRQALAWPIAHERSAPGPRSLPSAVIFALERNVLSQLRAGFVREKRHEQERRRDGRLGGGRQPV